MLTGLLLAMTAARGEAARVQVVLFPQGTSSEAANAQVGSDAKAYFATLAGCATGTLPCGVTASRKSRRIWTGSGSTDGETCDGPVVYPLFQDIQPDTRYLFAVKTTATCGLRLAVYKQRRLHFPQRVISTLASLSFGDMSMGVYFQPNVARGQKVKRIIFARGAVRKNGTNLTRNSAGMYFTETWGAVGSQPTVVVDQWIIDSSVSGLATAWHKYTAYPYTPQVTSTPYQKAAELVGTFINNANQTQWSDVLAAVGANQAKTFRCTHGGTQPIGSTFLCELYFNMTQAPGPI